MKHRFHRYLGAKLIPGRDGRGGSRRAKEAAAICTSLTTGSEALGSRLQPGGRVIGCRPLADGRIRA